MNGRRPLYITITYHRQWKITNPFISPSIPVFVILMATNQRTRAIELIRRSVTSIFDPRARAGLVKKKGERKTREEEDEGVGRRGERGTVRIPVRPKRRGATGEGGKGRRKKKGGTIEYLAGKNSHRKSVPRQRTDRNHEFSDCCVIRR